MGFFFSPQCLSQYVPPNNNNDDDDDGGGDDDDLDDDDKYVLLVSKKKGTSVLSSNKGEEDVFHTVKWTKAEAAEPRNYLRSTWETSKSIRST